MIDASSRQIIFPQKALPAMFVALAGVLLLIGLMRPADVALDSGPGLGLPEASMRIRAEDAPRGTVIISDAATGKEIQTFHRAEGSFLRATLRALVNDRRRKGVTDKGDFKLERYSGGQLYLIDETTGRRLALNAYGPDNSAVFAAFMSNEKGEGQ